MTVVVTARRRETTRERVNDDTDVAIDRDNVGHTERCSLVDGRVLHAHVPAEILGQLEV